MNEKKQAEMEAMRDSRRHSLRRRTPLAMGLKLFYLRLYRLITQPVFIVLTIVGNSIVMVGAGLLYWLEHDVNPFIHTLLDTVWWAVATVTTVGYGDIHPITAEGKVLGIGMMIVGTALFWSYTALFASAVVSDEIYEFEIEMKSIKRSIQNIKPDPKLDPEELKAMIMQLEATLRELKEIELSTLAGRTPPNETL